MSFFELLATMTHAFAFGTALPSPSPVVVSPLSSAVAASPTPSPSVTASLNILVNPDATYTAAEKAEQKLVQDKINEVVQSACFEDYLLHKRSRIEQTNGRTREEVIRHIRQSKASVTVTMYNGPSGVVGYTYLGSGTIHTNLKFYRNDRRYRGVCPKASNELHEITHVMGYSHDFKATARRPFSVPYSCNQAMNACCTEPK